MWTCVQLYATPVFQFKTGVYWRNPLRLLKTGVYSNTASIYGYTVYSVWVVFPYCFHQCNDFDFCAYDELFYYCYYYYCVIIVVSGSFIRELWDIAKLVIMLLIALTFISSAIFSQFKGTSM